MPSKASVVARLADSPLLPSIFIITFLCITQFRTLSTMTSFPSLAYIDTIAETNWSAVQNPKISLTRAHNSALLHRKVWIIPFDEMWQLALSPMPGDECPHALGAWNRHVFAGETVETTASDLAHLVRKYRRVTTLYPLGKPFALAHGNDREIVYAFALPVRGVFPRKKKQRISHVIKPVDFIQHTSLLMRSPPNEVGSRLKKHFCSRERAEWMIRATAYALRQFHVKGLVPRSNPMDNAAFNDSLCCKTEIDISRDLKMCGVPCDQQGLYNILSYFPQTR